MKEYTKHDHWGGREGEKERGSDGESEASDQENREHDKQTSDLLEKKERADQESLRALRSL